MGLDEFEATATLVQKERTDRTGYCRRTDVTQTLIVRDPHLGNRRMIVGVGGFYFDDKLLPEHPDLEGNYDSNEIPHEYVPLMVDPKTSKAAIAFYIKLRKQNFINRPFAERFLALAVKKGVERAERSLDLLLRRRPEKGKITIMTDVDSTQGPCWHRLNITDGTIAFGFYSDKKEVKIKLSPNPFIKPSDPSPSLNASQLKRALRRKEEFFAMLKVLNTLHGYVAAKTEEKIKNSFFSNGKENEWLTKKFLDKTAIRREQDRLEDILEQHNPLPVEDGYLALTEERAGMHDEKHVYHITLQGKISALEIPENKHLKEVVYSAVHRDRSKVTRVACSPARETLVQLAQIVGKAAPALSLIIMP